MMDIQRPHIASAGSSGSTTAPAVSRLGQGGGRREPAGPGKSFSTELHEAHAAKNARPEAGQSQRVSDESDEAATSDESSRHTPELAVVPCSSTDAHPSEPASEDVRHESETVSTAPVSDVNTQSVLLALMAQPAATMESPAQRPPLSAGESQARMESVMSSVMEDGTSAPVTTAADSSNVSRETSVPKPDAVGEPPVPIAASPGIPAVTETQSLSIAQPVTASISDRQIQEAVSGNPAGQESRSKAPEQRNATVLEPGKADVKEQPVVQAADQRIPMSTNEDAGKTVTATQAERAEENRPALTERPVSPKETPAPKEEVAPRHASMTASALQEFTSQDREQEEGMGWTRRDHRENPFASPIMGRPDGTEVIPPSAPPNSSVVVNGVDQRAFSSAPSSKAPADTHASPASSPVLPADWMPGSASSQTKSMVLELSQADLGRVNIRVAVNQEVVHTHFSSDRGEVGQYLQNGQDKLQSALQTSGLDLGRFQVDIDRQSAGRSFQQPASQDRSTGHSPQRENQNPSQSREDVPREQTSRRGIVNLVA